MAESLSFEDFLRNLQDLSGQQESIPPELAQQTHELSASLRSLPAVTSENVAQILQQHPDWVPILASAVGLGDEQLKQQLRYGLGTAGWKTLAKKRSLELVSFLDKQFNLLNTIQADLNRIWRFEDILAERYLLSRRRASGAIRRGRGVEDSVERIVKDLGLPYRMRTRFAGAAGRDAPCDLAIPNGSDAQIIIAAKGFNSTGSKLTDAVREIETIATVRLARQFVFVVVDGIGWLRRQADLRRIYEAKVGNRIDGLYSLATLDSFSTDLRTAAGRLGLV